MAVRSRLGLALTVFLVAVARASCPASCSGHGVCGASDSCACDRGFFGADCSMRRCPSAPSLADSPAGDLNFDSSVKGSVRASWSAVMVPEGLPPLRPQAAVADAVTGLNIAPLAVRAQDAHFYAECAGRGSCDRMTGQCECVPGYSGSACQRVDCPRGCAGHGVCRTVGQITAGALTSRRDGFVAGVEVRSGAVERMPGYRLWGGERLQHCVCDAGFKGPDCSLRMCPRGPDPLGVLARHCGPGGCANEVQSFSLTADHLTTFRIGFRTWQGAERHAVVPLATSSANGQSGAVNAKHIAGALLAGMADHVFDRIVVSGTGAPGSVQTFRVTFLNNPGNHPPLAVEVLEGPGRLVGGTVTTVVNGTKEELECSSRGICDERTGLCQCFEGYGREDCGAQLSPVLYLQRHRAAAAAARRRRERELNKQREKVQTDAHALLQLEVGVIGEAAAARDGVPDTV